jgi:hypothetical protein
MSRASARANDPTNGRVAPGVTRRPIRSEPVGPRQPWWDGGSCSARSDRGHSMVPTLPSSWDGGSCAARSDRGHSMVPTLPSAWDGGSCAARSDRGHSMVPTLPSARLLSALFMATANPEPLTGSPTPGPEPDDRTTEEWVSRRRSASGAEMSRRSRQWGHGPTCRMSTGCSSSLRPGVPGDVGGRATGGGCDGRIDDGTNPPVGPGGPA